MGFNLFKALGLQKTASRIDHIPDADLPAVLARLSTLTANFPSADPLGGVRATSLDWRAFEQAQSEYVEGKIVKGVTGL